MTPVRRLLPSLLGLLLPSFCAAAGFNVFPSATASDLKPFTRDIGGLLGAGANQTSRVLGFSGFDIGLRSVVQLAPEERNTVMKKDHPFSIGFVQAEIGMPYRVDGYIRAGSSDGLAIAGGGLRYGLRAVSDKPYYTQVMLVAMGNMASHKYFYATHFGANLMFSINVPVVAPYFGVGVDSTKLVAQTITSDPSLEGKKINAFEPKYTFGLRARYSLGYIAAGAVMTHGVTLITSGVGLRF